MDCGIVEGALVFVEMDNYKPLLGVCKVEVFPKKL